ncbi:hypothetical protein BUALT_Bualt16G0047400 [Buddleja alternifolia]|uniref:Beta-glucosidase n=1 Tax=Buddleja alternifolia TaxID=168488 RepID=A0AAV6WJQ4_9LAMI|nr:hypothetical protein BUALT_Bualt16G0047400 [Buddleja alternifolia]
MANNKNGAASGGQVARSRVLMHRMGEDCATGIDDVKMMKRLGIDAYRFSIGWSRILPGGKLSGGVNRDGVKFYNDLIDLLLSEGIEPYVTLFHFDVPLSLEEDYGGFLSEQIIPDFVDYASVCFFEFGDRVKYWFTINESWTFAHHGYVSGGFPPGHGSTTTSVSQLSSSSLTRHRCPVGVDLTCHAGDPTTEPYIVGHNLILAHAAAVDVYRRLYQAVQGGKISIVNMSSWFEPHDPENPADVAAAARAVDFMWGWFVAPIVTGDYPPTMREYVGDRLPTFSGEQKRLVQGSYDFIGMNYYTTYYATNDPNTTEPPGYAADQQVKFLYDRDGVPIGPQAGSSWLYIVPYGIRNLLTHTKTVYNDPIIYITENGVDEKNERKTLQDALKDDYRIQAHLDHFAQMKLAIDVDRVKLKGYFLWSLFDNYEWAEGYTVRFGMVYVDYVNGFIRYPKNSAIWYMNFLNKNLPVPNREVEEAAEARKSKKLKMSAR